MCIYSNIYTQRNNYAESYRSQMVLLIHPPPLPHVGCSYKIAVLLACKNKESWKDSGWEFFIQCFRGFLSTAPLLRRNSQKSFWQKSCYSQLFIFKILGTMVQTLDFFLTNYFTFLPWFICSRVQWLPYFFKKIKRVYRNISIQKHSETLLWKMVQYFVALLANLAVKFQKRANRT